MADLALSGTTTQRIRCAHAKSGWAEWLIGVMMAGEESKTCRLECELKAARPPELNEWRNFVCRRGLHGKLRGDLATLRATAFINSPTGTLQRLAFR